MEIKDYEYISKFVESKIPTLKQNQEFVEIYKKQFDLIDELDKELKEADKEKFNELIDIFYTTEKYYFVLSYSLGIKYGAILKEI